MKIAVLSDPHNRSELQRIALDRIEKSGVDYLLHAGDLCTEENLRMLKESGIAYAAVFGNNDTGMLHLSSSYNIDKEPRYLLLGNLRVKMMHLPLYMSPDAEMIVYGHTHLFKAESVEGTLYLNPGEICARESGECGYAIVDVYPDRWVVRRESADMDNLSVWRSREIEMPR